MHNGGKVNPMEVKNLIEDFYQDGNHEHMVFPGMLYISQPTEYGALYTRRELEALSLICRKYKIPLYLDGARLGYALASHENNVTPQRHCPSDRCVLHRRNEGGGALR